VIDMSVALICARKNSKGIINKNLQLLHGKPLIVHSINCALETELVEKVIVSTDCPIIAETSVNAGAIVPFLRPAELALDETPEWQVWRHAIENFFNDQTLPMVVLPPTGPLRTVADISRAIKLFMKGNCDIVITSTKAYRNPMFNMVKANADGTVGLANPPKEPIFRRQDAPEFFDITTNCYVVDQTFVMTNKSLFDGKVRQVVVAPETAVDIDTRLDLLWAEFLLTHQNDAL
jgi:CMP-N-acetylneuraminic acid synthetase